MKTCNRCHVEKDVSEFYKNSKRVYPYCKACAKTKYAQKHYQDNKEKYKEKAKNRTRALMQEWFAFRQTLKCSNCNEDRHWVIDLHHVDRDLKEGLIRDFFFHRSKKLFEQELKKVHTLMSKLSR